MTDEIERFFDTADPWPDTMRALRAVLSATPLVETWKWRSPVYCHAGSNVAILWNFRQAATLGFFRGALLTDPEGMLLQHGPNTRAARVARFTSPAEVQEAGDRIRAWVDEAIALVDSGTTVPMPPDDLDLPDELTDRLAADPDLAAAWDALTPGRRRGYVIHVAGAKQSATRAARIEKHAPRILQGKGMHDR